MEKNKKQHEWILDGIDCANCASKVERGVAKVAGVANSNVNYMTQTLSFEVTGEQEDQILSQVKQKVNKLEPAVVLKNKADGRLLNFDTLKSKNIQPEERKKYYEWILDGIDCANCANKVERGVAKVAGVSNSNVNYMTQTLSFEVTGELEDQILSQVKQTVNKLEPAVS